MKKYNLDINSQKSGLKSQAKRLLSFGERIEERGFSYFFGKRVREMGFILLLLSSFFGFSQVKVEVDTTNIRIGEQFQYKISVDGVENIILPHLKNLRGLEIVDSTKVDTIKNSLIKKYLLTGFDSGSYYIPQQQVFIRNQAYLTDSLLINVTTVAVDTTKIKKFPIKAIKREPITFDDYKHIIYWVLAIFLIVGTVLYFALRRKEDSEARSSASLLPPYQEALLNLSQLDKKQLWQNNQVKEYYTELTNIIRYYIERELHVRAMERTTDGLIENLEDFKDANTIVTDVETLDKLKKLLQESDLVKFAKSKPLAIEIENDRKIAEFIINSLQPKVSDEDIDVSHIQQVTIVQKPTIKKPSFLVKFLIIAGLIGLICLVIFGFLELIKLIPQMSNPINSNNYVG